MTWKRVGKQWSRSREVIVPLYSGLVIAVILCSVLDTTEGYSQGNAFPKKGDPDGKRPGNQSLCGMFDRTGNGND